MEGLLGSWGVEGKFPEGGLDFLEVVLVWESRLEGFQEGGLRNSWLAAFLCEDICFCKGNSYWTLTLRLLLRRRVWGHIYNFKNPPGRKRPIRFSRLVGKFPHELLLKEKFGCLPWRYLHLQDDVQQEDEDMKMDPQIHEFMDFASLCFSIFLTALSALWHHISNLLKIISVMARASLHRYYVMMYNGQPINYT